MSKVAVGAAPQKPITRKPVRRLIVARALRDFAVGFIAVVLPAYLLALGIAPIQVGIIATGSLLGSSCMTLVIALLGTETSLCSPRQQG